MNEHKVYPGNPCPHVTEDGCGIFDDLSRPAICGSYGCLWLKEWKLPDYLRPDKCGFILSKRKNYVLLTADFNGKVDGSSLIEIMQWCKVNNLTLFYTVKSSGGQDMYIRGSILNHSNAAYKMGTMDEIFEPIELFNDE